MMAALHSTQAEGSLGFNLRIKSFHGSQRELRLPLWLLAARGRCSLRLLRLANTGSDPELVKLLLLFSESRCFHGACVPVSSQQAGQILENSNLYLELWQGGLRLITHHATVLASSLLRSCCVRLGHSLSLPGPSKMRQLDGRNGLAQTLRTILGR